MMSFTNRYIRLFFGYLILNHGKIILVVRQWSTGLPVFLNNYTMETKGKYNEKQRALLKIWPNYSGILATLMVNCNICTHCVPIFSVIKRVLKG